MSPLACSSVLSLETGGLLCSFLFPFAALGAAALLVPALWCWSPWSAAGAGSPGQGQGELSAVAGMNCLSFSFAFQQPLHQLWEAEQMQGWGSVTGSAIPSLHDQVPEPFHCCTSLAAASDHCLCTGSGVDQCSDKVKCVIALACTNMGKIPFFPFYLWPFLGWRRMCP